MNLEGRVGVFGGAFDPIHHAHLAVARTALRQLSLLKILFVPNGTPPDGDGHAAARSRHRVRMVELAIRGEKGFELSRVEVDREGISYTIDTLRALQDDYAQGMCFILGADRLVGIDRWKEPESIISSVPIVVAPRTGVPASVFGKGILGRASIRLLEMPEVDLSSTALRERVRQGQSIDTFVPAAVAGYIKEHGLYRDAVEA